MKALVLACCLLWVIGCAHGRVDTIRGKDLAFQSNGCVGTFIQLDAPGDVTISLNASPRTRIVINDDKTEGSEHRLALPPGTYFVRIELASSSGAVRDVSVSGARICNELNDVNALAASETYIKNCRTGNVVVRLPDVAPGTEVRAKLVMKEFSFGTNAPGVENKYLIDNPPADSDAAKFQQFIIEHFNMLVPSNAGKWVFHEPTQGGLVSMEYADAIMRFARQHGLRGRMHNLIWGSSTTARVGAGSPACRREGRCRCEGETSCGDQQTPQVLRARSRDELRRARRAERIAARIRLLQSLRC
jgi:hypothetical protein